MCTQAEVWVWRCMFSWLCPDMVYNVTVGLAEYTAKSLRKHMETWYLVRPQKQTCANLINPLCRATETCVCVCVSVYIHVCCVVSVLSSPHPSPQRVSCQGYRLCLPTGLWSSGVQQTHTHIHTHSPSRTHTQRAFPPMSMPDVNQISSSVGTV